MLVTWPRCKNNCSSDFRLLFPGLGKKQIGRLNHFAFSRPGKRQIGSLDHIESLDRFAFSRAGKKQVGSLSQIWKKLFDSDFNFFSRPKKISKKQLASDLQTKNKEPWPNG